MTLARRAFLRALPALGFGAKAAAESAAAELAGVALKPGDLAGGGISQAPGDSKSAIRQALSSTLFRQEIESLLYERARHIYRIDPDLAVLRSFSLSAKITFQRQRNVAMELAEMQGQSVWSRLHTAINRRINPLA